MILSFELTMPGVASWNGRWPGEGKKYFVIRKAPKGKIINADLLKSFSYRWEDGWVANVNVEVVDSKEAAKRRKISSGFCGYEWMIDSVLKHGKITTSTAPIYDDI